MSEEDERVTSALEEEGQSRPARRRCGGKAGRRDDAIEGQARPTGRRSEAQARRRGVEDERVTSVLEEGDVVKVRRSRGRLNVARGQ